MTLTDRQSEVLAFIRVFHADNGFAPSVREIADHFGWFPTGAECHLRALQRKGVITRQSGVARSIVVVVKKTSNGDLPEDATLRAEI